VVTSHPAGALLKLAPTAAGDAAALVAAQDAVMELFVAASDSALGVVAQARTGSAAEREFVEQALMATGTKSCRLVPSARGGHCR